MPTFLSAKAQGVWHELAPLLVDLGTLTIADGIALEALANTIVTLRAAQDSIDTDGIIIDSPQGKKKNPACNVADASLKQVRSLLGEFGLTPASRTRIKSNNPEHGSALDQFLAEDDTEERNEFSTN
jgi:P27 family predicted phage terminase small subunit